MEQVIQAYRYMLLLYTLSLIYHAIIEYTLLYVTLNT